MTQVAVARNIYAHGFERPGDKVDRAYEVMELTEALLRTYKTDAHAVTYVVDGATRQPRINKAGLAYFPTPVRVGVFFCDLDNPTHQDWDDALRAKARLEYETLPVFQTAGLYHTPHGRRIVQPLLEPILAQEAEPYLAEWLLGLENMGLPVDWQCRDWTRHFRLPNVWYRGKAYRSPLVLLDRMRPIMLPPIAHAPAPVDTDVDADGSTPPATAGSIEPDQMQSDQPITWSTDVPEAWWPRIEQIASAVREVKTEWHSLFLALAGALMTKGNAAYERVPALCRAISVATHCDTKSADRERAARSTIQRRHRGQPATGYGELARNWPGVADALDAATSRGADAHVRALAATVVPTSDLAQATAKLEDALLRAPDGLTVISAECGLGKTQAAIVTASIRAAKQHANQAGPGSRAPLGSKTSIAVDKNSLARQVAKDLEKLGTNVRRIFGPLSVLRLDGQPECRFHEVAKPLVDGGQAMSWELCRGRDKEPCTFYDECLARDGSDGPADARVTVGPHALLSELSAAAGSTGLLVIDEPPPLLENTVFTLADLDTALLSLKAFEGRYTGSLTPALEATRAWLASVGTDGMVVELDYIVRHCDAAIPLADMEQARRSSGCEGDAVDCGRAAPFPEGRPSAAPPLQSAYVAIARSSVGRAQEIGLASRVLKTIHHALTSETPVAVRLEEVRNERVLTFTGAREDFAAALRREGPVVVTDASAEIHAPIYAKVVGYEPPFFRFAAGDGAHIERTLIRTRSATRSSWLRRQKVAVVPSLVSAVRVLFEWAAEGPACQALGLVTMRPIELALRAALTMSPADVAEWKAAGQDAETLTLVADKLGPIVRGWPGRIVFAHHGAVRGLNTMADVDALATLGDPWFNLDSVRNDAAFLGIEEAWEARAEALCRAELEQAHGRLRTVHRTRPGRALHIGNVLPSGSGWQSGTVRIRSMLAGRPKTVSVLKAADLEELVVKLGGMRAAARALDCDHATIHRYLSGKRSIASAVAARILALSSEPVHAR